MSDPTETYRRARCAELNSTADISAVVEDRTWTTEEMQREFSVHGFMAPFVIVERRSDGAQGTLEFRHSPRVYFNWSPA